jgi:hypothetical protein
MGMEPFDIACPCGAIRIAISGEPLVAVYCHCDDCQAVHGAAYLPAAIYAAAHARVVAGDPAIWRRKTTARGFCRTCGTRVFARPEGDEFLSVPAALLPPGVFRPSFHINCRFAIAPVRDALPHYAGFPTAMGGENDLQVEW